MRDSVLLRSAASKDYDLLFLTSNLSSAEAPADEVCPIPERVPYRVLPNAPATTFPPLDRTYTVQLIPANDPNGHSKRITPYFQTGSLQVAVSKTLRQSRFVPLLEAHFAGAFPIQP